MPLPVSGQLSIDDLRTEFGATGARGLSDFYRGGPFVPNTPTNSSVPTTGEIRLSNFYGAAASAPISVNVSVTVGRRSGTLGINVVDVGRWDGNPSSFTSGPWSSLGSLSTTNVNGLTLANVGYSDINANGGPTFNVNQRNFWAEFVGNVTASNPTSIDVQTSSGTSNYPFNSGLIQWSYNSTTNRTVWRHTFGVTPFWDQTDVGSTYTVTFNF